MTKELYVVEFESANYCGAGEYCLVWASNEKDAEDAASAHAEEFYYEQDSEQWEEENEGESDEDVTWANMKSAYPLASDEAEDVRKYLLDPTQVRFYPIVNTND